MQNPATFLSPAATADERIPGLPDLPLGTDRATLLIPVYDAATDKTCQAPLVAGPGTVTSNNVVGGPKLVQFLDSRLYGVPVDALTLDRLNPNTIVPGTVATVDNPSGSPLATTLPPAQYVATRISATAAGAVLVPAYIGAAVGNTVAIVWTQVVVGGYTDTQARAASLNRTAPPGTTAILLTAESPTDYGTASTGTFTISPIGCAVGKRVRFAIGTGGSAPVFYTAPAGKPYHFYGSYVAGSATSYSLLVCTDCIEVTILEQPAPYLGVPNNQVPYTVPFTVA